MEILSYLIEAHVFKRNNDKLEFLLLKRSENESYPNIWQMVSGKINEGEKAYEAALREIKEETNLTPKHFWVVPRVNSFYTQKKDHICLIPVFAAEVDDSDVRISSEHSVFKWVNADEAKNLLAWDGQRRAVDLIVEYFSKPKSELSFIELNSRL